MTYSTGNKESNLSRSTTLSASDLVRIVVGGISRSITASNFATAIQSLMSQQGETVKVRKVSTSQSVLVTDEILAMDASAANLSAVLPDCTSSEVWNSTNGTSKKFTIKKNDTSATYNVTLTTSLGQTIDGNSSYLLSGTDKPFITVVSDGVEWITVY